MVKLQSSKLSQRSNSSSAPLDWTDILWREWRHCHDREYAAYLFDFLIDKPLNRIALAILAASVALAGALPGFLLSLLVYPSGWKLGTLASGVLGVILGLTLFLSQPKRVLTWKSWFQILIPHRPLLNKQPGKTWEALGWVCLAGLASSWGAGWLGVILFDQPRPGILSLVVLAAVAAVLLPLSPLPLIRRAGFVLAVALLGLLFGLGFAQLAGLVFGPRVSGQIMGAGVGLLIGLLLGRGAGVLGTLFYLGIIAAVILMDGAAGTVLLAWLAGALSGGIISSLSYLWLPSSEQISFEQVYPFRLGYFWWHDRPAAPQVEAALAAQGSNLVRLLAEHRQQPEPVDYYLANLRDPEWQMRFISQYLLVSLGSLVVPRLEEMQQNSLPASLKRTTTWLACNIGWETTQRLGYRSEQMICKRCLTICTHYWAKPVINASVIYYGCRTCGQSRDFFDCSAGVVAVLDNNSLRPSQDKVFSYQSGKLGVNWFPGQDFFDFEGVKIVQATDEEVERFAVQVGNDTDPVRQGRYPRMICRVSCSLSENSWRILRRTFGEVKQEKRPEQLKQGLLSDDQLTDQPTSSTA